jgi:LmbE family N-acetylglucosaminyl deacetylase
MKPIRDRKRVLVIAPHPDDEILGAGGAIAKYARNGCSVTVLTVAGHRPPLYSEDVYQKSLKEAEAAHAKVGVKSSIFLGMPATLVGLTPPHELNGKILDVVNDVEPNIVLIPFPDRHIDHRIIFDSAMVATRPVKTGASIELLAAYETLSETHWNAPHVEPNFVPSWVVNITYYIDSKLDALKCFESQIPPFPGARSVEAVKSLAIFRGTQAGFGYGEAFHVLRMRG